MNNHRSIQDAFIVIMRITLTQILMMAVLSTLVSAASLNGQGIMDRKVTIDVSNTEVKLILAEIEKQASVVFTYRPSHIKSSRKISFKVEDVRLADALTQLFSPAISFLPMDDKEEIILKPSPDESKVVVSNDETVAITVTGRVLDDGGQPIPGVNVIEKSTTNGTTTDAGGRFSLVVQDENSILV
ncbi:MAG TPA: carboxypeptidase-like regulatory domain-containing protein, partial [Chryseolinea sp.]|nr:carboxypeptidase-like regulatory domain-containing protein [Chryseolinea sp.]